MTLILLAVAAGMLIGLSLGALGGGGSILAVPVLVYALDQTPVQATTGSLVVVGVTAMIGAVVALRTGHALATRGVVFGLVAVAGAVAGARATVGIDEDLLLAAFGVLMLVVAVSMGIRLWRTGRRPAASMPVKVDDPIITFSPVFTCQCPRALKVLLAATAVGLLTGFLGVGGGFLVVPALVLALGLPVRYAAGTSLVVITLTSAAALAVRVSSGVQPDWAIVAVLTVVAALAGAGGSLLASRLDPRRLSIAFTVLVLAVAVGTAGQAVPALV